MDEIERLRDGMREKIAPVTGLSGKVCLRKTYRCPECGKPMRKRECLACELAIKNRNKKAGKSEISKPE